jgi:hypothetical protein
LFERHPFERTVRWRTVANVLSIGFVVRRCFVLGREVVEGKQRFAILRQALHTGNLPERGVLLVIYCDN